MNWTFVTLEEIKKVLSGKSVSGRSDFSGFQIIDDFNGVTVSTSKYNYLFKPIIRFLLRRAMDISNFFYDMFGDEMDFSLRRKIYSWAKAMQKLQFEWHACEHKLCTLLNRNEEVSLDTLFETPSRVFGCSLGSSQGETLVEPSEEKLRETLRVATLYSQKLKEKHKAIKVA